LEAGCIPRNVTAQQLTACRKRLDPFLTEMLAPLGRRDRRHGGQVSVRGLLLEGERKSAGAMATRLPDGNEQSRQQFLSQSPWEWKPLWQHRAERLERAFPNSVTWLIEDTGFPKKGEHSVGVARQSLGHARQDGPLPDCRQPAPHRPSRPFAAGFPPVLTQRMDGRSGAWPGGRRPGGHRFPAELALRSGADR
jgi:DDE superfamily endonuclease